MDNLKIFLCPSYILQMCEGVYNWFTSSPCMSNYVFSEAVLIDEKLQWKWKKTHSVHGVLNLLNTVIWKNQSMSNKASIKHPLDGRPPPSGDTKNVVRSEASWIFTLMLVLFHHTSFLFCCVIILSTCRFLCCFCAYLLCVMLSLSIDFAFN